MEDCKKLYLTPNVQSMQQQLWERLEPVLGKKQKKKTFARFKKGFLSRCTKNMNLLKMKKTRRSK
jgi:hypothetical protein